MIELPWFPKACSPNARSRSHWPKTRAMKKTREWGHAATLAWRGRDHRPLEGPIDLLLTFYPPVKRDHDDDNLIASTKGFRDGIADALGVNDNAFRTRVQIGEPVKHGKIVVSLS